MLGKSKEIALFESFDRHLFHKIETASKHFRLEDLLVRAHVTEQKDAGHIVNMVEVYQDQAVVHL
ncbi:hypothetical protein Poly24_29560 [Rosistilla carotiformis]|uniref:Uncharacterized protein n=1 Tax=Rosistilla carotiformis TaxID=2528017 RepID=A0A518JUL2_9BACT|nr:hypothetical protein [Rosistilla carotiformis]QDV69241.1 hypothetical protein Poly24_29560 [Rosistilla carotiformis]